MFVAARVSDALKERQAGLLQAARRAEQERDRYVAKLAEAEKLSAAELSAQLGGVPWPGARPTAEWDMHGLVVPFTEYWATAPEARSWALCQLTGTPTVGVDGSQIAASREFGVPIALVQVAWFDNPHDASRPYVKDVRDEVVLADAPPGEVSEYAYTEARVNQRRFVLEMEVIAESARRHSGDRRALLFHDGSFVLSFAGRMPEETRGGYLDALFAVLDSSREQRVPLVGYVDGSLAGDLVTLLRTAYELPMGNVHDADLLITRLGLFERTSVFRCARGDILPQYRREARDYAEDLCFFYLQPAVGKAPARVDLPTWVVEDGLTDWLADIIRAEIIVGGGYPYALETADAAAVLTLEDRLAFYRHWQDFARDNGLPASLPAKTRSKIHRR